MNETLRDIVETIVFALVMGGFCFLAGGVFGLNVMRREAVKTGHAEYYIDADSEKAFRWKTNCIPSQITEQEK